MIRFRSFATATLLLALMVLAAPALHAAPAPGKDVLLARDGQARMPIVIDAQASPQVQQVAQELADYLQQITGATFEITQAEALDQHQGPGIILGTLEQFPRADLKEPLAIRNGFDGKEAYVIRSEDDRLLLIGATDLAASHAAFRFLETQGVRWWFPAKAWEVVPETPTLRVGVDEADRPALLSRRIWYQWGLFDGQAREDYTAWARHNRMAGSIGINAGHAWDAIIAQNRQVFDEHPEYLALHKKPDGTEERSTNKFCVSQEGLQQLVADYAVNFFDKHPNADMVSVDPSDGGGHCECDQCAALGSVSNRVFLLANVAGKAVQEKHPGKWVGLYAYNFHSEPPDFDLEPNVYIQLTAGFIRGKYSFGELMELWPQRAANMGFYEYFSVYQWNLDKLPGGNGANVPRMRSQIPRYIELNATSVDAESGNNWGVHGRGYIVANALMWDPETDVDALLADFYHSAFGPAAEAMQRYYERFDPGNQPLMSEHLMGQGYRDLQEATELAREAGREDVLQRLDHLKFYLRYNHLRWMLDRAEETEEQKRLTLETLTHVYRTRYSYMNHWEAMRQFWIRRAVQQFDEPSWAAGSQGEQPWAVEEPYTREEIDAFFQEGLDYFKTSDVVEVTYSDNLAPVRFEPISEEPRVIHDGGMWQGGGRYALYSIEGEPLTITVTPGTIAWYRDRPDATWRFSDRDGETVAEGRIPLDGEKHELTSEVPGPGLYYFDFGDSGAGWRAEAPADRPMSIPLSKASGRLHHGHQPTQYFYVPKGTQRIDYYWLFSTGGRSGAGGPHQVCGPDGKVIEELDASGEFISIEVPEGLDGQVWQLRNFALSHLWFFNIPNYLASSPNALLVPKEVAERDGLTLRTE